MLQIGEKWKTKQSWLLLANCDGLNMRVMCVMRASEHGAKTDFIIYPKI